jgi:hypothetical protein
MPTIVTKTLGVDYADFNAFAAALPASLVTADQQWILEVPKTAEFSFTTAQAVTGKTCDATRNVIIRPASGAGFAANTNVLTNALIYNAANGAAIKNSITGAIAFTFGLDYIEVRGLQFQSTPTSGAFTAFSAQGGHVIVEGNIIDYHTTGTQAAAIIGGNGKDAGIFRSNLVLAPLVTGPIVDVDYSANTQVIGNILIAATGSNGIVGQFTSGIAKDNAVFGCSTPVHANLTTNASNNATNAATINGTSSLTSLTQANQFVSTTDFRLKTGNALLGAGVAVTGWTVDILGQTVPTPAQIGATSVQAITTTPVSSDLAATYAVAAYVSSDLGATYTVTSSMTPVSSDLGAVYNIFAFVSSSLAASYNVGSAAGQFVTDAWINNAGTVWANAAVSYTWVSLGRIGSLTGKTLTERTGTLSAGGILTATTLPAGAGMLLGAILGADATADKPFYQAGTVT